MTAKLAITFDYHPDFIAQSFNMKTKNVPGTWYVAPRTIIGSGISGAFINIGDLILMQQMGHEIGVYTNQNMPTLLSNNRVEAADWLKTLDEELQEFGKIKPVSLAPNQRAWNDSLANLCRGRYGTVRVSTGDPYQDEPIPDLLNIKNGTLASLGNTTTTQVVTDYVDGLISHGGVGFLVVHKVSANPTDGLTVSQTVFDSVIDYVSSKQVAGDLKCIVMRDLI